VNVALLIIVAFLALAVGLALLARRGRDMDLEQWTAGGRGFGAIFVFLLMAGEIYSTFTFLGGAGLVYGSGGAAYYILGYGTLAYVLSYYLLPAVWRYATPRRLVSQADARRNVTLVIDEDDLSSAMGRLHAEFFGPRTVGPGFSPAEDTVGRGFSPAEQKS